MNLTTSFTDRTKSQRPTPKTEPNYKELYFECKKNVSLFISHVQNQLNQILSTHEQQKKSLKEEIGCLKQQLKVQTSSFFMSTKGFSNFQPAKKQKRYASATKIYTNDNILNCNLSEISRAEIKSIYEDKSSAVKFPLKEKQPNFISKKNKENKQNFKENLKKDDEFSFLGAQNMIINDIKEKIVHSRRKKRLSQVNKDDCDSVKSVLKDIRGKIKNSSAKVKQNQQEVLNLISPEMFKH